MWPLLCPGWSVDWPLPPCQYEVCISGTSTLIKTYLFYQLPELSPQPWVTCSLAHLAQLCNAYRSEHPVTTEKNKTNSLSPTLDMPAQENQYNEHVGKNIVTAAEKLHWLELSVSPRVHFIVTITTYLRTLNDCMLRYWLVAFNSSERSGAFPEVFRCPLLHSIPWTSRTYKSNPLDNGRS